MHDIALRKEELTILRSISLTIYGTPRDLYLAWRRFVTPNKERKMIHGYVILDGQKYFCGTGNTKRTVVACAEGNVRMVENELPLNDALHVIYSSNDEIREYPSITDLI